DAVCRPNKGPACSRPLAVARRLWNHTRRGWGHWGTWGRQAYERARADWAAIWAAIGAIGTTTGAGWTAVRTAWWSTPNRSHAGSATAGDTPARCLHWAAFRGWRETVRSAPDHRRCRHRPGGTHHRRCACRGRQ